MCKKYDSLLLAIVFLHDTPQLSGHKRTHMTQQAKKYLKGLALLLVVHRIPSLLVPFWTKDEGYWWAVGNGVASGLPMYAGAADNKPPLFLGIYALAIHCFGDFAMPALHALVIAGNLCIMLMLYRMARASLDSHSALYVAAAFVFLQSNFIAQELQAANSENLMLPWAVAAVYLYSRPPWKQDVIRFLTVGAFIGVAVLIRQTALIILPLLLVHWALSNMFFTRVQDSASAPVKRSWRHICTSIAGLMGGFALPIALCTTYFLHQGTGADAWYWNIGFNTDYIRDPLRVGVVLWAFTWHTATIVPCAWIVWRQAGAGVWRLIRERNSQPALLLWLGFLAVMCVATAAGGRFSHHYYLQLFAPLALLAGYTVHWRRQRDLPALPVSSRLVLVSLLIPYILFFGENVYRVKQFWTIGQRPDIQHAGMFVRKMSEPNDTLFVWGYYPELYFYSNRLNASRFVETHFLTGQLRESSTSANAGESQLWQWLWNDLQRSEPRWIIDSSAMPVSWRYLHGMAEYPAFEQHVQTHYRERKRYGLIVLYERLLTPPTPRRAPHDSHP